MEKEAEAETVCSQFGYYGRVSTSHCIPRMAAKDTSAPTKFFWTVIFLAASGVMSYLLYLSVILFLEKDVDVKVSVQTASKVDFPSVTICNMNPLKRSKLVGNPKYAGLLLIDDNLAALGTPKSAATGTTNPTTTTTTTTKTTTTDPLLGDSSDFGGDWNMSSDSWFSSDNFVPVDSSFDSSDLANLFDGIDAGISIPDLSNFDVSSYLKDLDLSAAFGIKDISSVISNFEMDPIASSSSIRNDYDYEGMIKASQSGDFSDVLDFFKPSLDDIINYGHPLSELLVTCSFDKKRCDESDFRRMPNQKYGNCFTFNHQIKRNLSRTSRVGSQYGLRLTLDPQRDEYLGLFSHSVGARITIHHHNVTPVADQLGFGASPGVKTTTSLRQQRIQRHPFSDCNEEPELPLPEKTLDSFGYSVIKCNENCLQDEMMKRCNCVDRLDLTVARTAYCIFSNETQEQCRQIVRALYLADELNCDCRQPCLQFNYIQQISTEEWPSQRFLRILQQKLLIEDQKNLSATAIDGDLIAVHIYFEELNYEQISESEAYPLVRLLSDIGGTMGLWIGISICSLFELVELCGGMLKAACCTKKKPARVHDSFSTRVDVMPPDHKQPLQLITVH